MKAIIYTQYGSPDVLKLKEVAKPFPKDNEVLIKVHAASINSWDWDMVRGKPFIIRMWGLVKPRYTIPGADIAGTVEAIGQNIKKFRPGDEVFGDLCESGFGAFAEYTCAREDSLTLKPSGVTFEEAASIPQAGAMALQSIRDKGAVKSGQKVLINGAGGGVGTFAVQLAKLFGAEVTGVDRADKLDMLRTLGADHVIDFKQEDFTTNQRSYDVIIDVVSNRSVFDYKSSLTPSGKFILLGGTMPSIFQAAFIGPLIAKTGNKKMGLLAYVPNKDLNFMTALIEEGKLKPVIDRCYPLHETAEAFRYFGDAHVKGKIVITMGGKDLNKVQRLL